MNPYFLDQELKEKKEIQETNSSLKIRQSLIRSLEQVENFNSCVLMDYPFFFNVGDHLIWLSLLAWLLEVRKARIEYVSSVHTFRASALKRLSSKAPLFFPGGGNLGDLWPDHQEFKEMIIQRYHDRPIILMPQSIFFKNKIKLKTATKIFNAHPNLTIFTREDVSFRLAQEYFYKCKIFKSPDIAFYFADRLHRVAADGGDSILIHRRNDQELPPDFSSSFISQEKVLFKDWVTVNRYSRIYQKLLRKFPFLSFAWRAYSVGEALNWLPEKCRYQFAEFLIQMQALPQSHLHMRSLSLLAQGIRQMEPFRFIISNRLHGHILSTLIGKPNVILPNSYHKNESFYKTWTYGIPNVFFSVNDELNPEIQWEIAKVNHA